MAEITVQVGLGYRCGLCGMAGVDHGRLPDHGARKCADTRGGFHFWQQAGRFMFLLLDGAR